MVFLSTDNILLIASILVFSAVMVTKVSSKFGVPVLLLFLFVGIIFGSDGIGLVFNNYRQAQFVGTAALTVILFAGGMETRFKDIRPVLREGIVLSTVGVFLTALFTGLFIYLMYRIGHFSPRMSIVMCFLLAAVMSSTDSATVFNILRNNRMRLKHNLQPMLELESGSNDPMAYCMTVILIQAAMTLFEPSSSSESGIGYGGLIFDAVRTFLMQIIIGSGAGAGIGMLSKLILKRLRLKSTPLYAIMLLTIAFFTISLTEMIKGNGYLAVYIAGFIIGNSYFPNKKEIFKFLDGMTWIVQLGMFLTLGLLVNPREMLHLAPAAVLIAVFLIFVARPLAVFLSLIPFRKVSLRDKLFVSWVGLKGAAPIIFATYPIISGVPGSDMIFNIVFFIAIVSMLFQGMTIPRVAKWLKLDLPEERKPDTFGMEIPEEAGELFNHVIVEGDIRESNLLKDIDLPEGTRVMMIKRREQLLVPEGGTILEEGDLLLMISVN